MGVRFWGAKPAGKLELSLLSPIRKELRCHASFSSANSRVYVAPACLADVHAGDWESDAVCRGKGIKGYTFKLFFMNGYFPKKTWSFTTKKSKKYLCVLDRNRCEKLRICATCRYGLIYPKFLGLDSISARFVFQNLCSGLDANGQSTFQKGAG